jgi:LPPG:FO 2-phospho-L-lactate transferase
MSGRAEAGGATYVALSGGVGGAKLSLGLARLLGSDPSRRPVRHDRNAGGEGSDPVFREGSDPSLSIIVNTGDDFEHLGLHVSPDVDTALYTLAGIVNEETGWGRRDETWSFMEAIGKLGGPTWFKLGDGDLAMHVERTRRLSAGETLTQVCAHAAERLGIAARILPMTDDPLRTILDTDAGTLAFQEYFVRDRCRPAVRRIRFEGAAAARPTAQVLAALSAPTLGGIVVCPSNPWLSVDPILAVPGLREAMRASGAPIVAVSPIVAGKALKGPAAKIMGELGLAVTGANVARHYAGLIDGFVLDSADAALVPELGVPALATNTVMRTLDDRVVLARECLDFCRRLADKTGTDRRV